MKKRILFPVRKIHAVVFLVILSVVSIALPAVFASNDGAQLLKDAILQLWDDGKGDVCSSMISSRKGYPFISIACERDYSEKDRQKFLDVLFSYNASLKNEDFEIKKKSGIYLYKVEYPSQSGSYAYIKLFFRNAYDLYPDMLKRNKKISIFVKDLATKEELFLWQSLGVPIAYSVIPNNDQSREIAEKISNYNQELWLSIDLSEGIQESIIENSLSEKNAGDPEVMNQYLNNLLGQLQYFDEKEEGKSLLAKNISGFVFSQEADYLQNIYALRMLLENVKSRQINSILMTGMESDGVVKPTALVMGYGVYNSTLIIQENQSRKYLESAIYGDLKKSLENNGYALLVLDAQNTGAANYLKSVIRKMEKDYIFMPVSRFPSEKN